MNPKRFSLPVGTKAAVHIDLGRSRVQQIHDIGSQTPLRCPGSGCPLCAVRQPIAYLGLVPGIHLAHRTAIFLSGNLQINPANSAELLASERSTVGMIERILGAGQPGTVKLQRVDATQYAVTALPRLPPDLALPEDHLARLYAESFTLSPPWDAVATACLSPTQMAADERVRRILAEAQI